jgi:hypothetical protein
MLFHILPEFLGPEFLSALRVVCVPAAFMAVPEASMNEDHRAVLGQDNVRLAREIVDMEAESVA